MLKNLKTLLRDVCNILSLVLLLLLVGEAKSVCAQSLSVVYDGRRTEAKSSKPSRADVQLIKRQAMPKARRFWRNSDVCDEGFEVIDVASGSFTRPNAAQRAVLYRFCTTGHNFGNNGIAFIEGRSIVAHLVYEGGEDYSIDPLPDINGNGLTEIVLGNGSTHQGYTVMVATLIEASPSGVKKFGIADAYEDDCGANDPCKTTAYLISAKPGPAPIFYREAYEQKKEKWIKAGRAEGYSLREDESRYTLLN